MAVSLLTIIRHILIPARLLVTPFRTQNTPPPMPSYTLTLLSNPAHVACSTTEDALVILYADGSVQCWDLNTKLPDPKAGSRLRGGGKVADPQLRWTQRLEPSSKAYVAKQIAFGGGEVAGLFWTANESGGVVIHGKNFTETPVSSTIERIVHGNENGWLILDHDGRLTSLERPEVDVELCARPSLLSYAAGLLFALSPSGKLIISSVEVGAPHTLASTVTSFTLTEDFLIYTTSAQSSQYCPITTLQRMLAGEDMQAWETEWESRRIERGALAVVACPSSMSLVLQMPRGNLETVYPRPLVLAVVRRDVQR